MIQTWLSQGNLWWIRRLSFFNSSESLLISLLCWYSGSLHDWYINFNPSCHLNVFENGGHQSFWCRKPNHEGNRIRVRVKSFERSFWSCCPENLLIYFPLIWNSRKFTIHKNFHTRFFTFFLRREAKKKFRNSRWICRTREKNYFNYVSHKWASPDLVISR